MQRSSARSIARVGVLAAMTAASIILFRIPGPGGNVYFHLGETVMLTSAVLLGKREGALIGAIGAAVADLLVGAALWAPFSFVIHGAKGYVTGRSADGSSGVRDFFAIIAGTAVMVCGYTLLAGVLYGASVMPVEFVGDLMQGGVGVTSSFILCKLASSSHLLARGK